jgi:hypothetical protein
MPTFHERILAMASPRLTYEEWKPYIRPIYDLPELDGVDPKVIWASRQRTIHHRVDLVTKFWDELSAAWPQGTALDYCLALELEEYSDENVFNSLKDPNFIKQVLEEGERRGIRHQQRVAPVERASFRPRRMAIADTDSSSDDDSDSSSSRQRRWTLNERVRFKEVVTRLAQSDAPTWHAVAKEFPERSPAECESFYKRLRDSKERTVVFKAERSKEEILRKQVNVIVGVEFRYKEMSAFVGFESEKLRTARLQNPLVNYIDQLTHKTITFAAMSPDYFVLDYYTWVRCLRRRRVNPFSQLSMTLRDVILLTFDNIGEHYDKIRNLEESRPPRPEDDMLPKFLGL